MGDKIRIVPKDGDPGIEKQVAFQVPAAISLFFLARNYHFSVKCEKSFAL